MGLSGWIAGKVGLAVVTLGLYAGAATCAVVSPVFPPAAGASIVLFVSADATGAMLISPIDPVSTAAAVASTVVTGPL
jgi:hypothetical protein